ncbi:Penicillin-binding protein 4* [Planctomycetes bacterium Poly30]|uniref:Penicillin-binding protein 4 n=1 Tax=Saltatorellus ferox TaxID=2528018 RepID=A0A518EMT9_9BACT|nr:Penicillin-binding protein 4* [Planctomycetes bacterium Poly30]
MPHTTAFFVTLLTLFAPLAQGQEATAVQEPPALSVARPVEATLAAGEGDSYFLEAAADQFVSGVADQESVDVIVRVFGPDEAQLAEFDGPSRGPERFTFETEVGGRYRIEVTPFEQEEGRYTLTLETLEPLATGGPGRVDQLMAAYSGAGTPGGVIGVIRGGEVLFEKAYGMANLVHEVPFSVQTPSNLGSTSKQFTGFAIALLEAEGLLSFDDDVRKHIPELPDLGEVVTLRHLLTHTSGYREFLNTLAMGGRRLDRGDHIDRVELIEVVQRQPSLQNPPGADWNYNNTGFGLLTVIVERVTGETFPDWMKGHVFEPLGMTHTVVRAENNQIIRGSAQGYGPGPGGFQNMEDLGGAMGAGAIYSTVGDLAKWMRNLQTGELGGADVLLAMTTPFELTSGKSTGYGFGLFIDQQGGLRRFQHGGADTAHRAMLMVFPDIEGGVVALSNNAGFDSAKIADQMAEAFFGDEMKQDTVVEVAPAEASAEAASAFDPTDYDPVDFEKLAGRYELEEAPGFVLAFTSDVEGLHTQATGQPRLDIVPTSPLSFKIQGVEAEVVFEVSGAGECTGLVLHQNGAHRAKRLTEAAWAPTSEQMAAYSGRYFSEELETFYSIEVEGDRLMLRRRRQVDASLMPAEEHVFVGPSQSKLTFVLGDSGEITGFEVSAGRTRGVTFQRVN